jgi:hypothetical protein
VGDPESPEIVGNKYNLDPKLPVWGLSMIRISSMKMNRSFLPAASAHNR